jgi:hypothetical protein
MIFLIEKLVEEEVYFYLFSIDIKTIKVHDFFIEVLIFIGSMITDVFDLLINLLNGLSRDEVVLMDK